MVMIIIFTIFIVIRQVRFNGEEGCGLQEEPGGKSIDSSELITITTIVTVIILSTIIIITMTRKNSWRQRGASSPLPLDGRPLLQLPVVLWRQPP